MMRHLFAVMIVLITYSFAKINIQSFSSDFTQRITNDQNKTILYEGRVYFKAPYFVKWEYRKPIKKSIYLSYRKIVIIEPEIEQIIIQNIDKPQDLLQMIQSAKKIDKEHYVATINRRRYDIFLQNGKLKRVLFKDEMGNRVEIVFHHPKQNIPIDDAIFSYSLDPSFDIIYK